VANAYVHASERECVLVLVMHIGLARDL